MRPGISYRTTLVTDIAEPGQQLRQVRQIDVAIAVHVADNVGPSCPEMGQQQRQVATAIKSAREMALLPYPGTVAP